MRKKNPILDCLADQMTTSSSSILEIIYSMLETDEGKWPGNKMILKEEWIKRMKYDPQFYWFTTSTVEEMMEQEKLMLLLCAKALKRQIVVIPFLEDGSPMTFGKGFKNQILLMGLTNSRDRNFFISIFPNKKSVKNCLIQ